MSSIMEDHDVEPDEAQRRLFRFGFICFAAADPLRSDDETWAAVQGAWPKVELGSFVIHRHPETLLSYQSIGGRHVVLIGEAFAVGGGDPLALVTGATDDQRLDQLDRLSGQFALLILDGDDGQAFHDAFGTRAIFYRTGGAFVLASHPQLLACACGIKPVVDPYLMDLQFLPGDITMFPGVYALPPNHRYGIASRKVVRYWPRKPRGTTTFDRFFDALDDHCRALIGYARSSGQPLLSLTGGVDSRLLVSAFRHHGAEFSTVTFRNFHFEPWEAAPVAEMIRYLGGRHHDIMEPNDIENALTQIAARNSGRLRGMRKAVVTGMGRRFGRSPGAVFVTGLAAGAIRGFYNLGSSPMRDLSPAEMVRMFLTGGQRESIPLLDPAKLRTLFSAFEGFCERAGYHRADTHGFDVNDMFFIEHRVGMSETNGLLEIEIAIPSIIGFNNRAVCEVAYGLTDDERLTKELYANVMARYDAHIGTVPFWPVGP